MKIVYLAKKIINMYAFKFWTPLNKFLFIINGVKFGDNLRVRGRIFYFQHGENSSVTLGNNVQINSSSKANPIGCGDGTYIQMVDDGRLFVGNNCGISNTSFTCATEIRIEDNVLLGAGCRLFDTDFHALEYKERLKSNYKGAPIKSKPIRIKEGAFVGAGSIILKGVTIGSHSVIGAGSVVTKSVPSGEIWAGNPARFIRKVEE